jgi:hypothetical protein
MSARLVEVCILSYTIFIHVSIGFIQPQRYLVDLGSYMANKPRIIIEKYCDGSRTGT